MFRNGEVTSSDWYFNTLADRVPRLAPIGISDSAVVTDWRVERCVIWLINHEVITYTSLSPTQNQDNSLSLMKPSLKNDKRREALKTESISNCPF